MQRTMDSRRVATALCALGIAVSLLLSASSCKDEEVAGEPPVDAATEPQPTDTASPFDVPAPADAAPDTPDVGPEPTADVPDIAEPTPPPFQVMEGDRVGVAVVDLTPKITETYSDLNGNHKFDGCRTDPDAQGEGCDEPFDDANGNGEFDAVFIAGFGDLRAAMGVHDPIEARAIVFARGEEYVALVALDFVGLGFERIAAARDVLAEAGWARERIIVASTHNHQGPDVRGLWGNQDLDHLWSGANPAYNAWVSQQIVLAVQMAAEALEPVTLRMGTVRMRDRSEWFNGKHFGGKNPKDRVHGLIHDIRDPIVVSDQVFALRALRADNSTVATMVNFAGHPETVGEENPLLSADYVHYLRAHIEAHWGGSAVFFPECLGGMQSSLGAPVPLVDEGGAWVFSEDSDSQGPVWAEKDTFDFARSVGVHVGDAAIAAVDAGKDASLDPLIVLSRPMMVPVDNGVLSLLFAAGLFDMSPDVAVKDPEQCPEYPVDSPGVHPGCVPVHIWQVRLGPASFSTAPGELLPEVFWGLPSDDPRWESESTDPSKRGSSGGRDSVFFPQHPPGCDSVTYADCKKQIEVDGCDCTKFHDVPYRFHPDPAVVPMVELLEGEYRFLIGNVDDHLGYIVPENDFNTRVSMLTDEPEGDHYEETVSASYRFATKLAALHALLSSP